MPQECKVSPEPQETLDCPEETGNEDPREKEEKRGNRDNSDPWDQ